jgi:hypothetical protein
MSSHIHIEINDFDEKVLKHELLSVQEWVQSAVNGKIASVKKRLTVESQQKLFEDPEITAIPATVSGSISLYFEQPYYQDAAQKLSGSLETP